MSDKQHSGILNRMFVVFGLVLLVPFAIGMQLFRINILDGNELQELWNEQAIDYISIPAKRGNIYDDSGSLLATNSVAYTLAIDPKVPGFTQERIQQMTDTLGKYSNYSSAYFLRKIDRAPSRSRYVVLTKDLNAQAYEALQQLNYRGIILQEDYERRYSFGSLGAHVLGFVNHKMSGMRGLEKRYNEQLNGEDGLQQVRRKRDGSIYAYVGAPRKQPEQGHSLYSTLDSHIQAIVEEELEAGVARTESHYGTAIVLDPNTGAVKAMANYPTYNPNNPSTLNKSNRRNFAIADMIEPGSTFKLVTAIAATEQGKVDFDEEITTPESGKLKIHGQWMRDHDPLGTLTFPEVIAKSSNVGTSKIAMRLSPDTFYQYARNLGFGTPTNLDLPNEKAGRLQKPYNWSKVTLPWMSIGYEVQITPIQLAQAYSALANGGKMMEPFIVKKIVDDQGQPIWEHEETVVRQVAKKETIQNLYPVFEEVVSDSGTASKSQVEGLSIAGKTGTAQKLVNGRYVNKYRSSFVGFFPTNEPQYVVLVILDDPGMYPPYGGWTAGPIFQRISKRIAGLDNEIEKRIIKKEADQKDWFYAPKVEGMNTDEAVALLKSQNIAYTFEGSGPWIVDQKPAAGDSLTANEDIKLKLAKQTVDTTDLPENYSIIPDVRGMSMREAIQLISNRGFKSKIIGSGTVYKQYPRIGDQMKKGRTITIRGKSKALSALNR